MSLRRQLDELTAELTKIRNDWEASHVAGGPPVEDDYLEHLLRQAYLKMLAICDTHSLNTLGARVQESFQQRADEGLLESYMAENTEIILSATLELSEFVHAARGILEKHPDSLPVRYQHAVDILRRLPIAASRLSYDIDEEDDLDLLAESLLIPTFPQLNSNPTVSLPINYRMPDTLLPTISTLVEYKHIPKKGRVTPIADEVQADISNYSAAGHAGLIVVAYQTGHFTTEDAFRAQLNVGGHSFDRLTTILLS